MAANMSSKYLANFREVLVGANDMTLKKKKNARLLSFTHTFFSSKINRSYHTVQHNHYWLIEHICVSILSSLAVSYFYIQIAYENSGLFVV